MCGPVAIATEPMRIASGCTEPQEPTRKKRFAPNLINSVTMMSTLATQRHGVSVMP